ncbi:MAG: hypothetical protein MJ232_09160 [archaeon]|nr:hypothetical protein [archaeon]
MKLKSIDEIYMIYNESGKLMYDATLSGNYKVSNREAKKLIKYFKIFEVEKEYGFICINKLLESNNVVVKTKAAAYCLALNYNIDNAVAILENIVKNEDNGIFGFNAKMTLKVWRENGYLKIY